MLMQNIRYVFECTRFFHVKMSVVKILNCLVAMIFTFPSNSDESKAYNTMVSEKSVFF